MQENSSYWKPGQSGNPSGLPGRPKGIIDRRTALTGKVLQGIDTIWSALSDDEKIGWARKNMNQFMAIASKLIPSEVRALVESVQPVGLDATDVAILKSIKELIPSADSMSPEQVLGHIRDALAEYESKVVLALPAPGKKDPR